MYNHILITTDGSDLAQKGMDQGLSLAKQLGSKVTIVTITEPFPMMATASSAGWVSTPNDVEAYNQNQLSMAQNILKAAQESASAAGVTADYQHIKDRWPAEAIVEYAAENPTIDLIVMTSHGRRGFGRLLLGSQTIEVLTHSKVATLVVR